MYGVEIAKRLEAIVFEVRSKSLRFSHVLLRLMLISSWPRACRSWACVGVLLFHRTDLLPIRPSKYVILSFHSMIRSQAQLKNWVRYKARPSISCQIAFEKMNARQGSSIGFSAAAFLHQWGKANHLRLLIYLIRF